MPKSICVLWKVMVGEIRGRGWGAGTRIWTVTPLPVRFIPASHHFLFFPLPFVAFSFTKCYARVHFSSSLETLSYGFTRLKRGLFTLCRHYFEHDSEARESDITPE